MWTEVQMLLNSFFSGSFLADCGDACSCSLDGWLKKFRPVASQKWTIFVPEAEKVSIRAFRKQDTAVINIAVKSSQVKGIQSTDS